MAQSSLYAGEKGGARIMKIGRIGFDEVVGGGDLGSHVFTGTLRSERVAPAGVGALINFRRVAVHIMAYNDYEFTVKVWIDDGRTTRADGTTQTVTVSKTGGSELVEVTEEIEIEGTGSHIQIEITADSNDLKGVFLIESIKAKGRVIRLASGRSGVA